MNNLLATGSDSVQIWNIHDTASKMVWNSRQAQVGQNPYDAPLTSFDWSPVQRNLIATGQLNGVSCIHDLETSQNQQLIAHEGQVNAITFTNENNQFVTGGQEGQVRFFDLRNLQTSTIIYQQPYPVLQVLMNRVNQYQLAVVLEDFNQVFILDIRNAAVPQTTLSHSTQVNYAAWFPSQNVIGTTSDDKITKIFDLSSDREPLAANQHIQQPLQEHRCYQYAAPSPINQLCWSNTHPNKWLGMTLDYEVQLLKF